MKPKRLSIFSRISILFFALITLLCLLFMGLTYLSVAGFHEASTQLLNKDVAGHIAKFTSPFRADGIDRKKADSVFYDAMVLSPSAEVYFLDSSGKVVAFHANEKEIRQWVLPLDNIKKLIASDGSEYIKSPDPRDPENTKIFSAAEVEYKSRKLGYIYVILGSNKSMSQMLYASYFGSLLIKVSLAIVILSILFALLYIARLRKNFDCMVAVLSRFQNGDFSARFPENKHYELLPVTTAFNQLADLLVYNIDRLTHTEKERKDFVANISHDLRTPLSIARGYTETLLMEKEKNITGQQREEFLHLVYRKIQQVEHMVKQLFDLSKMESVTFEPKKEPFVFSEVLQEIIQESTPSASVKNIRIDSSNSTNASWIFADIGMMERVIQNLLVNAILYTPSNGNIRVTLEKQNDRIVFMIRNSGEPLTEQTVKWFNDKSGSDHLRNRPAYTGIGLTIVKTVLQLHHLEFELTASADLGNTFTIYIPVYKSVSSK